MGMTKQRRLVLEIVKNSENHLTVDEVYSAARKKIENISLATVYRNLNCLCADGKIRRVELPEGPVRYDRNLSPHEHMKCTVCGRLIDCSADMKEVMDSLRKKGLCITGYDLQFLGVCKDCLENNKKNGKEKESL